MEATAGLQGEGREGWLRANLGVLLASKKESPQLPSLPEFPGYTVSSPGGSGNSPGQEAPAQAALDKARKGALNCGDQGGRLGSRRGRGDPGVGVCSSLPFCCCDKTPAKSKSEGTGFISSYSLELVHGRERSQGRSSSQEVKQRPWRARPSWRGSIELSSLSDLFSHLFSYF